METVNGKYGDSVVITMKTQEGVIIRAWATQLIREYLNKNYNEDKSLYIISCGPKIAEKSKNTYYEFKTICK